MISARILLQPFYGSLDFVQDYPGEPVTMTMNIQSSSYNGSENLTSSLFIYGNLLKNYGHICAAYASFQHAK